jgi:predicted TIM-barrel fold metal-dependent hydrolase
MRIDAHVHADVSQLTPPPHEYLAHCRDLDIERVVLIQNAEETFAACRLLPDLIIPVPWVDMDVVTPREIHETIDQGAKGIKFLDPQYSYGDPRYDPLYRTVAERGKVAVFHTGYIWQGYHPDKTRPTDITLMRPAAVDCMARRHPTLRIIMAHFGNPWWEEAWKILVSNANIWAELSGGTAYRRSMLLWRELFAPNGVADLVALNKLLFATDLLDVFSAPRDDIEPYFAFYDGLLDAVGASEELRERINRGNALELFGIG